MKLAVSMYCYVRAVQEGRLDILSFIDEAKRIGADGVELLDFFYKDAANERDAIARKLAQCALPCPIFSVANNFAKPSVEERTAQVDRIKFGVDEAEFYGAQVVRVFAGDVTEGLTYDQVREWTVEGLATSADYARKKNVKLALENHGKLAGRGDQVCSIIADVRAKCGHDALGANPDTGNFMLVDQDSVQALKEEAPYAYMVHFKDFAPGDGPFKALSGKSFRGTVIGDGQVDLEGCVNELKKSGFQGWLSLEYEGHGDPFVEVQTSLDNARKIIGEPAQPC